jgi:hypothetical protein
VSARMFGGAFGKRDMSQIQKQIPRRAAARTKTAARSLGMTKAKRQPEEDRWRAEARRYVLQREGVTLRMDCGEIKCGELHHLHVGDQIVELLR